MTSLIQEIRQTILSNIKIKENGLIPQMPVVPTEVYILKGITYVPHYLERNVYMAPGSVRSTKASLISQGASVSTLMLWKRGSLNYE